ncbi:hypothetical protein ACGFIX_24920 [Nocardia salmonicida]|uniref:hypothetical protein n=1 Tax=Nocardia salmonicida TaxID=53431 RepID=UPI0037124F54
MTIAREPVCHLVDAGEQYLNDPQFRLQLGLLAAQIALAERLPGGFRTSSLFPRPAVSAGEWDRPTITSFLEGLPGIGVQTFRILVDEGGRSTP